MDFNSNNSTSSNKFSLNPGGWGSSVLLPQVASLLAPLEKKFGIKFTQPEKMTREQVVALGKIAESAQKNAQQFPVILRHLRKLLAAEVSLAGYYAELQKDALSAKIQIDKQLAKAFVALTGYQQQASVLANKTSRALQMQQARYGAIDAIGEGEFKNELQLIEKWRQSKLGLAEERKQLKEQKQQLLNDSLCQDAKSRFYTRYGHLEAKDR